MRHSCMLFLGYVVLYSTDGFSSCKVILVFSHIDSSDLDQVWCAKYNHIG